MKYLITGPGADKGEIHDVEIIAKKFNGVWAKIISKKLNGVWERCRSSIAFVCYEDIRILEMTEAEKALSVYLQPGYPGKE